MGGTSREETARDELVELVEAGADAIAKDEAIYSAVAQVRWAAPEEVAARVLDAALARPELLLQALGAEPERVFAIDALLTEAEGLLRECIGTMDDPCHYDDNNLCQAHFLHERPCPYERAAAFLAPEPTHTTPRLGEPEA